MTATESPEAVIFDLDGVLVDSETVWDAARRAVVGRHGGTWRADATRAMMGMSSPEWAAYLRDQLGVRGDVAAITAEVVALVERQYETRLPLLPGAAEMVSKLGRIWPLGLASSSNRSTIELFLEAERAATMVQGHRLVGGGAARQAGTGRLSRSGATSRRGAWPLHRDRGLHQRHPSRYRGRNGGHRPAQRSLPAGSRRARRAIGGRPDVG